MSDPDGPRRPETGRDATGTVDVSVVIVSWNTRDLLRDCIASIQRETRAQAEVIVVDNASRDGTAAMLQAEFPQVRLIANADNRGFAAANNQGLAVARGRILLLLNPDTVILDGAIDRMLAWMERHPRVGAAGCQVWETPQVIQRTCFADPTPANLLIMETGLARLARIVPRFGQPWYRDWDRTSDREIDVVSGMFLMVPRAVLDAVGPLDPTFFIYGEEADWCRRIRAAGWRCAFTTAARILHLDGGSKSTEQIHTRMHVQMHKSQLGYSAKHNGRLGHAAVRVILLVSAGVRLALAGSAAPLTRGRPRGRLWAARRDHALAALRFHLLAVEPGG